MELILYTKPRNIRFSSRNSFWFFQKFNKNEIWHDCFISLEMSQYPDLKIKTESSFRHFSQLVWWKDGKQKYTIS